jgi:hypothetical protein
MSHDIACMAGVFIGLACVWLKEETIDVGSNSFFFQQTIGIYNGEHRQKLWVLTAGGDSRELVARALCLTKWNYSCRID